MDFFAFIKKTKTAESECRRILADCENPNNKFPSYSEEYDIAAFLYNLFSDEDESYPHKAYINAVEAIKDGFHTQQNLRITAKYLYNTKNVSGLKQLCRLILDDKFCFRHTPNSAWLCNDIIGMYKELSKTEPETSFILFTIEEEESIYNCCKKHIKTIEDWIIYIEQERQGMRSHYVGVRDARRVLYNLDYTGINLSYDNSRTSRYDDLKISINYARKHLRK